MIASFARVVLKRTVLQNHKKVSKSNLLVVASPVAKKSINSFVMEVPIVMEVHIPIAEQINGLVSL